MEGFTNGQAIFKEIFDQVRKDLDCELFYSELKRHNVSLFNIPVIVIIFTSC